MKGESWPGKGRSGTLSTADAEQTALLVLGRLVSCPDRIGRFLALTGLDPASIRTAATGPGFLAAVMDHAMGDEDLLLALAAELDVTPDRLAGAQAVLSPVADWSP